MAAPITTLGQKIVPTIWNERTLKRDFQVVLGKMLQSEQRDSSETEEPYLRSANIQWTGVDVSDVKTMWFSPVEKRELPLLRGDLVVNEGGDVGRCAIWNGEIEECYFQNAVNRVRARKRASTRFLYYWLYNIKLAGFIDAIVGRTTIAHLTAERLEALPWPDIPPQEQQRIAAYLDASCAAIDAAVAAKRRQIETLTALRKSIIQRVVTKGLNPGAIMRHSGSDDLEEIPSHWRTDRMKDVVKLRNLKTDLGSEEADYLELEDIESGTGRILNRRNTLEVESAVTLFKKGDILFGKLRPYLEKYFQADFDGKCTGEILAFEPDRINSRFLFYCIASPWFIKRCNTLAYGAKMPRVNWQTQLAVFILPLPPADEQEAICDFLDTKLNELSRIVVNIEAQITTLTAYRKSLIHECVTGQRRVTEEDVQRATRVNSIRTVEHQP
jgi:type I restriction enzyme S subunit